MIAAATWVPWVFAALLMVSRRTRRAGPFMTMAAAIPAVGLALFARGAEESLPWLLLGSRLAIDDTAAVFMICSAIIWMAAALYAHGSLAGDPNRHRFEIFFLWTMGAQLGLATSRDIPTFYLLFFVATIAPYGLVVHDGSARARHAGLVYLVMALLAEAVLLPGLLLAANAAGTLEVAAVARGLATAEHCDLIIGLLLAGFAVKAGLPPLHVWLPLAHPAAPTPASAVLSGVLINAGLLGWLRFLPLGVVDLPVWSDIMLVLGLVAALLGALFGTLQRDAKSALAYSSVSQMGWAVLILALGLGHHDQWPVLAPMVLLFFAHHGLAKAALFLGVGVVRSGTPSRVIRAIGLAVPALAIAGAPGTTGAVLKSALKHAVVVEPAAMKAILEPLLTLASWATAIVLLRALALASGRADADASSAGRPPRAPIVAWMLLTVAVISLPLFTPRAGLGSTGSVLPILLAIGVCGVWRWRHWRLPHVPPGDLLVPLTHLTTRAASAILQQRPAAGVEVGTRPRQARAWTRRLDALERWLAGQRAVTRLFLGLLVALAIAGTVLRPAA